MGYILNYVVSSSGQLLRELSMIGIFVRVYANDEVIICRADNKDMVFSIMRFALGIVEIECKETEL